MKKTTQIVFCFFFFASAISCVNKNYVKRSFHPYKNGFTLSYVIPAHYKSMQAIFNGGEAGAEYDYLYDDSSVIYVTDNLTSNSNYENIVNQPDAFNKLNSVFMNGKFGKYLVSDTISLDGRDSSGLLWKHLFFEGFSAGYSKVHQNEKADYDKALMSIKIKCFSKDHFLIFFHRCDTCR